jgi:tetratricopeptide (TPR) repeat protein
VKGRCILSLLVVVGVMSGDTTTAWAQAAPGSCQLPDALSAAGEIEAARTFYIDVLKADPSSVCAAKGLTRINTKPEAPPPVTCRTGDERFDAGKLEGARNAYERLPTDTQCAQTGLTAVRETARLCAEGDFYLAMGRKDDALTAFEAAEEKNPRAKCANRGVVAAAAGRLSRAIDAIPNILTSVAFVLLVLLIAGLILLLLGYIPPIGYVFAHVPGLSYLLRPRLTLAAPDDSALGFRVGVPLAGRIKERLQRYREEALGTSADSRELDLDFDRADQEFADLVSGDSTFKNSLDKLSAVSEKTKALAGAADLVSGLLPIKRLSITGVVEPPGPGASVTMHLERNTRTIASAHLTGPTLKREAKSRDYLSLADPIAVWAQYVVGQALKGDQVEPDKAEAYARVREGVDRQLDGDEAGARTMDEQALQLDAKNWPAKVNLALLEARLVGNFNEAIDILEGVRQEMERT